MTTVYMHKNLVKFGHVVSEICEQPDVQIHSLQYFALLPWAK